MHKAIRKKGKRAGNGESVDQLIVSSNHSAARGDVVVCREDMERKTPTWALTQSPPKNFLKKIQWLQQTIDSSFSQTASGGFVELGAAFALSFTPSSGLISSLYDQYCIYSIHIRCVPELGNSVPISGTGLGTIGQLISAIDYDSVSPASTWAAYQAFGTSQETAAVVGKSYERYVKPTCVNVVGGSNSATATGLSMTRAWLNTAFPAVPHFGVRFAAQGNTTQIAVIYRLYITYVIGMRNNF